MVYNSRLEMTYLVITSQNDIADDSIKELISKLWDKDISLEKLGSNPDYHIIDGRLENSIGIEQIKDLQDEMQFKPFQERVQIAMILDAKKLTTQAQNAFLKTLEDSSDTTIYILVAGNEKELLPTIVSRSKKVYSKSVKEKRNKKLEEEVCFGNDDLIYCFSVFEKIAKDKTKTLEYLDTYLNTLQEELRNGIKEGISIEDITEKISLVNITKGQVNANGNRRLLLENLHLQIRNIA
jgi:DNA polymerase III delta prime subunit